MMKLLLVKFKLKMSNNLILCLIPILFRFQVDFGGQWPEDKNRNVFSSVAARDVYLKEEPPVGDDEYEDTNKMIEYFI